MDAIISCTYVDVIKKNNCIAIFGLDSHIWVALPYLGCCASLKIMIHVSRTITENDNNFVSTLSITETGNIGLFI